MNWYLFDMFTCSVEYIDVVGEAFSSEKELDGSIGGL